ncbi:MAG: YCF48-related protein [Verrucomicrobiota bacterium]|nr:YCF48-related protein [Verrucomicrobiota bacterium]
MIFKPNQFNNGPGFAPARYFFAGNSSVKSLIPSLAATVMLCFVLSKLAAQSSDAPAVMARLAKRAVLLDVHGQSAHVTAVGERGHILLSDDNGKTWAQQSVPTRRTLNAVCWVDSRTVWAVGHQSIVLRSRDGGANWAKVQVLNDPETAFMDILFIDPKKGFIVGSYGKLFSTNDGGEKWTEAVQDEDPPHFYQVTKAPDEVLWLIGEFGTVWRSVDFGQAWEPLDALYDGTFFGALPLARRGALVFGLRGNVFRSEDGTIWESIKTPTNALLHGGTQLKDGRMILTAGAGELLLSENKGRSCSIFLVSDQSAVPTSLWQAGDDGLLVSTDRGMIRLDPGVLTRSVQK